VLYALFFLYELFQNIVIYFIHTTAQTPEAGLTPSQRKFFRFNSSQKNILNKIFIAARLNGLVFLVFWGFHTRWYYPVLLWAGVFLAVNLLHAVLRRMFSMLVPALLGLFVVPLTGVGLWFLLQP
jgi:hypothetical protein